MYLYEGFPDQSRELGQVPNPDNMPTNPLPPNNVPPAPMPNVHSQQSKERLRNLLESLRFQMAVSRIRALLTPPMRADDVHGIQERRRLLRATFRAVLGSYALSLLFQLQKRTDPLGRLFRYKLATPTRNELLRILMTNQTSDAI